MYCLIIVLNHAQFSFFFEYLCVYSFNLFLRLKLLHRCHTSHSPLSMNNCSSFSFSDARTRVFRLSIHLETSSKTMLYPAVHYVECAMSLVGMTCSPFVLTHSLVAFPLPSCIHISFSSSISDLIRSKQDSLDVIFAINTFTYSNQ